MFVENGLWLTKSRNPGRGADDDLSSRGRSAAERAARVRVTEGPMFSITVLSATRFVFLRCGTEIPVLDGCENASASTHFMDRPRHN